MTNLTQLLDQDTAKILDQETKTITFEKPKKAYKNIELEQMLNALQAHLNRTDIIGYAAARNTRILTAEAKEYLDRRQELISKYGSPQLDDSGNPTGLTELRFDSENFAKFAEEIEEWSQIEHTPDIYKIPAEKCIGILSGNEILEIDWMLED